MQKGHCLCGSVQYEFDETQAAMKLHCHCKDCQRVTGSGKATVIMFPQDAVNIEGEYKTFASRGFDGSHVNRGFCLTCGSQMFTFVDEIPGQMFIKAGGMEDTSWLSIDFTCWTSTARDWMPPDDTMPGFEQNPAA